MLDSDLGHEFEGSDSLVDHAGLGVEGDDADEESLGSGELRIGFLVLEDPLDEIEAVGAGELLDGELVEGAVAVELGGGGGGEEEVGEAVRVGFGSDVGFDAVDGIR